MANKKMHTTKPARHSFSIIARCYGVGAFAGCVPPVKALDWLVILGVRRRIRVKVL